MTRPRATPPGSPPTSPQPPDFDAAGLATSIAALIDAIQQGERERATSAARAAGFRDGAAAVQRLERLGEGLSEDRRRTLWRVVLPAMVVSPDPDLALVHLIRYGETRFVEAGSAWPAALAGLTPPSLRLLVTVFGFSPFLAELLIRYPDYLEWLEGGSELDRPRDIETFGRVYRESAGSLAPGDPARRQAAIRAMRRELLRLGVRRMLELSDETEMMAELSDLAAATLAWALGEVAPPLLQRHGTPMAERVEGEFVAPQRATFAVIAMGKLGGRELNFSSDIDLLFVYSDEGQTTGQAAGEGGLRAGRVSNHLFYTRLAEALIAYLCEPSDEGYFYRVDARLRPEGETGPLVRSLSAYEIYYETQAQPWERLALLKARFVAGDATLGRQFEAMSRPLVFDPLHREALIQQMYDLKLRIDAEIARRDDADREVKRGTGGIREIEFLVQTMQMMHGAGRPALWSASTLEAIAGLSKEGLIPAPQAAQWSEDYVFLRTLEHRLQMMQLRQTHRIPDDPDALDALARRCGVAAAAGERPGETLERRRREVAERVHRTYREFFEPHVQAAAQRRTHAACDADPAEVAARLVLTPTADETAVVPSLRPFGLGTPAALKILRRLGGMGRSVYLTGEGREYFARLLPHLLERCALNPRPEAALAHLESFLMASGALASFYAIFLANPAALDLLLIAFGGSDRLAQTLIAHPEYADYLCHPAYLQAPADREAIGRRIDRVAAQLRDAADRDERFAEALARCKHFEYLLAGVGELAGLLDYEPSCDRVCRTAEAIVIRALARVARRLGLPLAPPGFAVLALGKLGGGELTYNSDLDLIFVWDESFDAGGKNPGEVATAMAEALIALLTSATPEGMPYAVDARLRPEGQNAPLAPPLSRYETYYRERAQLWEFQSAMKLRPIAGDQALGERMGRRVAAIIARRCGEPTVAASLASEVRAMRDRMAAHVRAPRWAACDLKAGPGGTVDVEFIAQYLQLRHLGALPDLMGLGPLRVFDRLAAAGGIDADAAAQLTADYIWLRRLERRARLLFHTERPLLPSGGEKLEALERACRSLTQGQPGSLLDQTRAVMARNREMFDALVR